MHTYALTNESDLIRCRWVHDELHETRGSYGLDTTEETKAAEDEELAMLESGEWVVLGCIVERKCGACGEWKASDSLWGIVIEPKTEELEAFALDSMELA